MLTFAQPQPPTKATHSLSPTHTYVHLHTPFLNGGEDEKKVFPPWSIPPHRTYITCLTCVILVPESGITHTHTHTLAVSHTSFHSVRNTGTCVKLTALALVPRPFAPITWDHRRLPIRSSPSSSHISRDKTVVLPTLPYLTPPTSFEAPPSSASITRPRLVPRPSVIAHPFNLHHDTHSHLSITTVSQDKVAPITSLST